MKYERYTFMQPGVPTQDYKATFSPAHFQVPKLEYPISSKENFRRAYTRNNPMWVPCSLTETTAGLLTDVTGSPEMDWGVDHRYDWTDWFGCEWTFVNEVGGSMLKPGTHAVSDICNWEKEVKWPELNKDTIRQYCEKFMKERYDPEKIIQIDFGQSHTERLVAILGGYAEAMMAMALEPEAVKDFFEAHAEWCIKLFDMVYEYVPMDAIVYHDDFGTERDTFFSEKMMEELVLEPSNKLYHHIKENDICFILHSCGCVGRFLPYMIEFKADMLQLQVRANDMKKLKEQYGDKIGFMLNIRDFGTDKELMKNIIHETVDVYGKGGGLYCGINTQDAEMAWDGIMELYCHSREVYEK